MLTVMRLEQWEATAIANAAAVRAFEEAYAAGVRDLTPAEGAGLGVQAARASLDRIEPDRWAIVCEIAPNHQGLRCIVSERK